MSVDTSSLPVLAFGPFVLDRRGGRLLRDGQPVELAPKLWAVLVHLCEHAGELVSKDELLDAVWGHRHVSDSVLKVTINGLRSKLGDSPSVPLYIETVPRRGYRFMAPVAIEGEPRMHTAESPLRTAVAASAVPAGLTAARGNLPVPGGPLVGRDAVMAELQALLAAQRLVTVLGPGGVGKTQLALHTAARDAPADGVWLVRLDTLADAAPLLDTIARTLQLGANASRSVQALALALSPLSLRLVLDNAEHLIDALVPLVVQCLQEAPRLQVLVTSQTPLRVAGETLLPLPPLPVPPAGSAADASRFAAVALCVQRVQQMLPQFQPGPNELDDIAALCRLLDGLPLAIELAAARVPLLGTAGVRARMSDRFALLSRGARDAPERHRTLRQTLEWSFGLLGADEQRVLRRLSVFAGSFTWAMAARVAGDGPLPPPGAGDDEQPTEDWLVIDALQTLQDHSLLATDLAHGEPRLRMLESVRALAAEQLRGVGEEAATRGRLACAMCGLFREAQARFTRTPLLHWLQPLRPEADSLRAAMQHALDAVAADPAREGCTPPLRLALQLFSQALLFVLRSGRKREAHAWYQALAPHLPRLGPGADDQALRAACGLAIGALAAYGQSMKQADALPWLADAEAHFTQAGDHRSAMLALYLHAALKQRVAPTEDRSPLLARMQALAQPDWTLREHNFAAWTAAVNAHGHGDLHAFRDFCAEDLQRAKAGDDRAEAWLAAFGLGQALWILGERVQAVQTLAEAVDDLRASGLLREYATTAALGASMRLAVADGSPQAPSADCIDALREAADLARAEGMLWWMGDALMLLPAQRGDWPSALRLRAWIDERMAALGMQRSPVAASLLQAFDARLAVAQQTAGWTQPEPAAPAALVDAEVLRLAFG